jgi:hypothetical protein
MGTAPSLYRDAFVCRLQVAGQQGAYAARLVNRKYRVGWGGLEQPPPSRVLDSQVGKALAMLTPGADGAAGRSWFHSSSYMAEVSPPQKTQKQLTQDMQRQASQAAACASRSKVEIRGSGGAATLLQQAHLGLGFRVWGQTRPRLWLPPSSEAGARGRLCLCTTGCTLWASVHRPGSADGVCGMPRACCARAGRLQACGL